MTQPLSKVASRKLRIAGTFILAGLIVEALSLAWNHPLAMVAFLGVGGLFLALGVVIYLLAVLAFSKSDQSNSVDAAANSASRQV